MPQGSIPNGMSGIACQTVVNRIGEMFGDFSFEFDKSLIANDVTEVTKWGLRIDEEDLQGGKTTILENGEIPISKRNKVVKLHAGSFYFVQTRVYNNADAMWGPWSDPVRAATMNPVKGKIEEISEDYVRVHWDRAPRDMTDVPPERDQEGTQAISDIAGLELLVLRESDMRQEFCERFATGVRAHTVHGLRHSTAYIVMIRYQTLINTMKVWSEVGRFYTQPSNIVSLVNRGEDTITVSWKLGPKPVDTVGYHIPEVTVHRYELTLESETEANIGPIELPASDKEHRVGDLIPGTVYNCYVRSLSVEGRWGSRSEALQVRTADRLELSIVASGETFLSFTWVRQHDEFEESKVEYLLQSPISAYKQQDIVEVGPNLEDKVFHLQNLSAGTVYSVSARTFLQGEWGLWSDPCCFKTQSNAFLSFSERGEDFFTVAFERPDENTVGRFNIVVTQISRNDERVAVLDEEVVRTPEDPGFRIDHLLADTVYEVKCRLWQQNRVTGYEGWGDFAKPVRVQTLQQLGLHVWDLGEDFMQLVWRRGLVDPGKKPLHPAEGERQWSDLKYEVVVGCLDTGEDEIVHKQVLETSYTITNLRPATTYIVSVRACNEFDQWGVWSKIKLRTLASVLTSVHEIGEDFVRLMWQRQNIDDKDEEKNTGDLTTADLFVSKYAIFVYAREDGPSSASTLSGYHMGGNSEVARYEVVPSEHTSLRVGELLHDREYVAVVRASTATGKWGLWSKPLRFRTNPQFRIPVNNLTIGENYVNLVWSRDGHPLTDPEVFLGDLSVTGQQLRIHGVDTQYSKDHTLAAEMRELKIYGLSPATAYTIQIRVCGKSGNWGLWSPPVYILTRDTVLTKAVEVAEDYAIIAWERRKVANPKNYPTGRGVITSYHLRVYNVSGIHSEVFLGDVDCPYRISDLTPDTFYCVELKANYNDEEWGLWSTPLWCLSMKNLVLQTKLISEEFCCVTIKRPYQQKRLPEDDGNRASDDRILAFGQFRPNVMLCVTSPTLNQTPHITSGFTKPRNQNSSLPPNSSDHRLIYQTEILCTSDDTNHTIPNLKSNTVYSTSVRSKLTNGEWGMWSLPPLLFATVPAIQVEFADIGEKFVIIDWKRNRQIIPPQIEEPSSVACGLGTISASRVKVRETGGSYQKTYELQNSLTTLRTDGLSPATTYAVSVQTYNDNYEWGVWSEESILRTIPSMDITIQHVSEDAVWVSWARKSDLSTIVKFDTVLNMDVVAKAYEIRVTGEGYFCFTKEMDTTKLFFRGLQPDSVYTFEVRGQSKENQEWGLWSSQSFRTKPRLRVTFGNVGEHFAIVEWRRYLPAMLEVKEGMDKITESPDLVQQFRLKVEQVGTKKPKIYDLSPYISNFRLKDLEPSAEYRVWLCAKGYEGVWGFWNDESRVRTLPKLELEVSAIGEDYVTVTWRRGKWMGEVATDSEAEVREVDGAVSGYRVRVLDADGEVVATQSIGFRETSCTLTRLNLFSLYSVEVSAKDTYNEWGLWSDPKLFVTLEEVDLRILQIGEVFAEVEWGRQSALRQRGRDSLLCDESDITTSAAQKDSEGSGESRSSLLASFQASSHARPHNRVLAASQEMENNADMGEFAAAAVANTAGGVIAGICDDDEEESSEYFFPVEALRGDAGVQQWQVRVHCHRVFGGQPGAEDFMEFFSGPDNFRRVVDSLLPNAMYTISVRAQDKNGLWGHWSQPRRLVTYPLLVLTADSINETFIHVSWSRPPMQEPITEGFLCFPPITDIHNYQVHIEPLASEVPFDEKDEPLVKGCRVYETSQPSLRLSYLTPGVRYRVVVCEQLINAKGVLLPEQWGSFSATTIVEMVNPMGAFPIEIGENYCHIGWHRVQRAPTETKSALCVITSEANITALELRVKRLDEFALPNYVGPLALNTAFPVASSSTSFQLKELVSNTIYAVSVRAQTEGFWGPWSEVTKFVTLNRLQVHVHSVYEDTFAVEWSRPQPEWARGRRILPESVRSSQSEDDLEAVEGFSEENDWNSVLIGDYSVERYELCVEGITCDLQQCLTLPGNQMSTCITDLRHNQIYAVCIRSQSAKEHWSMFSRRASVLTLGPICVEISHYTENIAQVRWFRSSCSVHDFADVLSRLRVEVERQCDERERQDLFTLKRRMQETETVDRDKLNDQQAIRREHNMAVRMDATHHLALENVVLGDTAISSYQMRFFGEGCMPTVQGFNRMLAHPQQQRVSKRRRQDGTNRGSVRQRRANGATYPDATDEAMVLEDTLLPLIDVELNSQVTTIVIKDLTPNMPFWLHVRARNVIGEWAPWSARAEFTTLRILELHHRRFGEHYINLYWHRLPIEEAESIEAEEQRLQELNEEFKTFSQKDLEERKLELTEEAYEMLIERLKSWRDLKRQLSQVRGGLESGAGEVIVHEHTPIKGYQLRVIRESGSYADYYIDSIGDTSRAFTVTKLEANTMYVVLLACDYGVGWGMWSAPLKFMTQNLIQLSLEYVAETFVDIEWHRAANKRLPSEDESTTLTSDTAVADGRVYQVRITYTDLHTGEEIEEFRTMRSCSVFRVDGLFPDTKYTFCVREWDVEGDWGLWCTPKTCVTLTGMCAAVDEIGEDWALLSWRREDQRVDYDDDLSVLQYGVENTAYYLMVQEMHDNDDDENPVPCMEEKQIPDQTPEAKSGDENTGEEEEMRNEKQQEGEAVEEKEEEEEEEKDQEETPGEEKTAQGEQGEKPTVSADSAAEDEMEGIFTAAQQRCGPLPPQEPPNLFEGERNGRFHMTRRFSANETTFRIEGLRPNKFYTVQVMCETTGGQLGAWSAERIFVTMSKICLTTERIDEEYVDLQWFRPPPRQHPRLDMSCVFTGKYNTVSYVFEVNGDDGFHVLDKLPGQSNTGHRLDGLTLDTVYAAQVHSIGGDGKPSLWSETLRFVTLNPVTVRPAQITERSIVFEWGREAQRPCGPDGKYDPTIQVGSRNSSSYLVRVAHSVESGRGLLLEKNFTGDTQSFHLTSLTPNTPYLMCVRATNSIGEWGIWSVERCIYTMKLLCADVAAVGEDYIRLLWKREEPDEVPLADSLTELQPSRPADTTLGNGGEDDETEEQQQQLSPENPAEALHLSKGYVGSRKKVYPLLDRPEVKSAVYNSDRTIVASYAVSVRRMGDTEGYTIQVPGDAAYFTVPSLRPDVRYTFAVRACYGNGEWGPYSPHVASGTNNLLASELCGLGEDYLTAAWQRLVNSYDTRNLLLGNVEETVSYELAVHDFTDVPFGEEGPEHLPSRLHRTLFVSAKHRTATAKELLSNRRYMITVRRWYKPLEPFTSTCTSVTPNTDDEHILEILNSNNAMPGTWSEGLYAVTLRNMICVHEEGAEDFFSVRWERDPYAPALPVRNPFPAMPVESYRLRIDEMTPDGSAVDTNAGSFHVDQTLDANVTTFQAQGLKPDSVYRVDVRACVDRIWGRWSRGIYIMTLPKLVVGITSIGEDYAMITWQRPRRCLVLPDGTEIISRSDENVDKFQLEVDGVAHSFHVSKKFKSTRVTYRVKQLDPNTLYAVTVRSCDERRGAWSLWSEQVRFATLKPILLTVGPAAEQFVTVEWRRDEQSADEYDDGGSETPVLLGNPEIFAFHLCCFNVQQTPSFAVVDKQFPKDVNRFCLHTLTPDTPHAVIVRACNTESRWGPWSREGNFRTLRLLQLHVTFVGENYVSVRWEREEGDRSDEGPGSRGEAVVYQLLLRSGSETIERLISHSDCGVTDDDFKLPTFVMDGLSPATTYLMALQPGYEENRWGHWTATVSFKTLHAINLVADLITADHINFAFARTVDVVETEAEKPADAAPTPTPTDAMDTAGTASTVNAPVVNAPDALRYQLTLRRVDDPVPFRHTSSTITLLTAVGAPAAASATPVPAAAVSAAGTVSISAAAAAAAAAADGETNGEAAATAAAWQSPAEDETSRQRSLRGSPTGRPTPWCVEREIEVHPDAVTSCLVDGLQSGTAYVASARALDVNGTWGSWIELPLETAPLPPRSVSMRRMNAQFGLLQWEAPDNRYLYRYMVEQAFVVEAVRGKSRETVEWRVVDTVEETTCRVRVTAPTGKMRCRVKCAKSGDGLPFSESCEPVGLSSGMQPDPVTGLTVVELTRSSVTAEWAAARVHGETGSKTRGVMYRVYLGVRDYTQILVTTTRATSHVLEDLEPSTEYTLQVVAENSDGMSYNNPMLRVTTCGEHDATVLRHDPERPPLGTVVEPLWALKRTTLPEIPSAMRQTLVPTPPGNPRGKKKRRTLQSGAMNTSPSGSLSISSRALPRTDSVRSKEKTPKKKKRDKLPSVRRSKS